MPFVGTSIELLTAPNPVLDLKRQPRGAVTSNYHYENIKSNQILPWRDFSFQNIKAAYGHLFELGPFTSDALDVKGSPARVERESDIDNITFGWCQQICRLPIKAGAERTQRILGLETIDVSIRQQGMTSQDSGSDGAKKKPDWSVFLNNGSDKRTLLVWGENKCSSKWSSDRTQCPDENWIWPWRQLLTYCANSNVRYGFLLTPEELVVVRVYRVGTDPETRWWLQYKSIPWADRGRNMMTVNLAIWSLTMMSVNEGHRFIQSPEWTLPLTVWWVDVDRRGVATYEHHLSGYTTSSKPSNADIRKRPTRIPIPTPILAAESSNKRRRTARQSS